ncbi:VOC family protein [Nocardia sp. NPDC051929]|uniref:VOC family protein n=1 Tax=unclassified Nocardia TaxID=2637762 RepID=UPI00343C39E4
MSNITAIIARVIVENIDAALPLYQDLADADDVHRFAFRDVELASVGPFLLISGNTSSYRNRVATLAVKQLAPVIAALDQAGGEILEGPAPTPNGDRLIARHPDGSVFEYVASTTR